MMGVPASSSLENCFYQTKSDGRGVLVAYLTLGDPSWDDTVRVARVLANAGGGVDIIELGWPSVDPYLDGPVIRESHYRACAALMRTTGLTSQAVRTPPFRGLHDVAWNLLETIRSSVPRPIVLMGYREDLLTDSHNLVRKCKSIGIDAVLIPDAHEEELQELDGLTSIRLFDPSMDGRQIENTASRAAGFAYIRSHGGSTGSHTGICLKAIGALSRRIRQVRPNLPQALGFGLRGPEDVATVIRLGFEGAIVGSAIVEYVSRRDWTGIGHFVASLRAATRLGSPESTEG